jgi:zinc D-Ala-D-Ala carboxypeptidase
MGTFTCALAAGATWLVTTSLGELRVVGDDAPVIEANAAAADETSTTTTSATTTSTTIPDCSANSGAPTSGDPASDWASIVVDRAHALPASFVPPDIVSAEEAGFDDGGDQVRQIVVDDLSALRQAAADNDTPIVLVSGYRSYERQAEVFADAVAREGPEAAQSTTAQAGHSEHQLGTAIDVLDAGSGELTADFADTAAGRWLADNAHRYGFVLSYPDNTAERSCYSFEPWHLRYVGRDTADAIVESGLTPREWMLTHG